MKEICSNYFSTGPVIVIYGFILEIFVPSSNVIVLGTIVDEHILHVMI